MTATLAFEALGSTARVVVAADAGLDVAAAAVRAELAAIDRAASRFRVDSELSRLNNAGGRPFAASPLLFEAVAAAVRAAAATDGDVDPTIGRSLAGLGWDRDFSLVLVRREPPTIEVAPARGWRSIRLDRAAGVIRVPDGVELDLGATAKALAADRSARAAHAAAATGVLVSLGGDVAIAGPAPLRGWPVRVTDDHRSPTTAAGQTVALREGALATSSTTVRRWRAGGAERHHIVDPASGQPAREIWRTVSVAAATCVDANTASTAAIVRGEAAPAWLEGAGLAARLVDPCGRVVRTCGWPA